MRVHVGAARWWSPGWEGRLFDRGASPDQKLAAFSNRFDAAEWRFMIRAVPAEHQIAEMRTVARDGFRFCVELPRVVTHHGRLAEGAPVVSRFMDRVQGLGNNWGCLVVTLPVGWKPDFEALRQLLRSMPQGTRPVVNVRRADLLVPELQRAINGSASLVFGSGRHEVPLEMAGRDWLGDGPAYLRFHRDSDLEMLESRMELSSAAGCRDCFLMAGRDVGLEQLERVAEHLGKSTGVLQ